MLLKLKFLHIRAVINECVFSTALIKFSFTAYVENVDPTYINICVRVLYVTLKTALTIPSYKDRVCTVRIAVTTKCLPYVVLVYRSMREHF